jgi:calcium-dependent protein kinase
LVAFKKFNNIKKAALTYIATRLKDEEIKNLKEIFNTLDKDNNGSLTLEEVKAGVEELKGGKEIDFEEVFKSIDTDGSGVINYTEFLAATMDQKLYMKEERLYEAFKVFDKDNSGKISAEEIKMIINDENLSMEKAKDLIKTFDTNGDGEIDYNEFITMMSKAEI